MLYAAFGMYHADRYIKLFKLYFIKSVRIILYKIVYINIIVKSLLLEEIQKTQ